MTRNRRLRHLFIWLITGGGILFFGVLTAHADFEDLGFGARPMGMGRAFVGLSDDSRAIFYNPAGLTHLKRTELTGDYARLYAKPGETAAASSGLFSMAVPLSPYKTRQGRNLGTSGLAVASFSLDGGPSENIVWLSYGNTLLERLSCGMNLKVLTQSDALDAATRADRIFSRTGDRGGTAYGADLGFLYNLFPRTFVGLAVSDVALNSSASDKLPAALKTGLAFRQKKLNTDADLILRDGEYKLNAGGEHWYWDRTFAVRLGGGYGSNGYKNIAAGFSVNWIHMVIEYALVYPVSRAQDVFGDHRISLVYRFGKTPPPEIETGSVEYYYEKVMKEAEILRSRLEKAENDRARLERALIDEATSRAQDKQNAARQGSGPESTRQVQSSAPRKAHEIQKPKEQKPPVRPKTYTVEEGDTLSLIADKIYQEPARWKEIYQANKGKVDRGRIEAGTVLNIP